MRPSVVALQSARAHRGAKLGTTIFVLLVSCCTTWMARMEELSSAPGTTWCCAVSRPLDKKSWRLCWSTSSRGMIGSLSHLMKRTYRSKIRSKRNIHHLATELRLKLR